MLTIISNFIIFSISILICNSTIEFTDARLRKVKKLSSRPILSLFDITPSYIKSLHIIIILFLSSQVSDPVFLPIMMVLITKFIFDTRRFASSIIELSGLVAVVISVISIHVISSGVYSNPFTIISYLSIFSGIVLFNHKPNEDTARNISRYLALNILALNISDLDLSFLKLALIAYLIFYIQFIAIKILPKLNIFERAEKSFSFSILVSFTGLILVSLWELLKR